MMFRYIMTSEFTLGPTENFFKDNEYFGLCPSNVVMFEQRMIPAVGFDGKIILEKKSKIAMAPGQRNFVFFFFASEGILILYVIY